MTFEFSNVPRDGSKIDSFYNRHVPHVTLPVEIAMNIRTNL